MTRIRWVLLVPFLAGAAACSGASSDRERARGGEGGTSGGGGSSGVGPHGGEAGASAGSGASTPVDPTFNCPATPYAEPPAAVITGNFPSLDTELRMGREETDTLVSNTPLPGGGFATIMSRGTLATSSFYLTHATADLAVTPLFSWPMQFGRPAFVRADAQGNLVVAGVATTPFTVGDTTFGLDTSAEADGFVYLFKVDEAGTFAWSKSFAFRGELALGAVSVSPAGEIALAGAVLGELSVDSETVAPPAFEEVSLQAAYTLRLDPDGSLVHSRVFHATGTHNDPPALDGAGGTDGFGQSSITDIAFWPDGALVVAGVFRGGIVLGEERLPNDGSADGLIVTLDQAGEPVWARHVRGRIGENIPNTDGSGGSAGFIPPGEVGALSVGVADDDKVTVTGPLWSRAVLEGVPLDAGPHGFFSGVFDRDGAMVGTNADGGTRVARIGSVGSAFWDGASLFLMDDQGSVLSSFAPGGELLDTVPVELARGDNLLFAASFLGRIDLGTRMFESAGCADTFVAAFGLPMVE